MSHLALPPFQVVVKSDKVSCAVLWQKAPEISLGVLQWWLAVKPGVIFVWPVICL